MTEKGSIILFLKLFSFNVKNLKAQRTDALGIIPTPPPHTHTMYVGLFLGKIPPKWDSFLGYIYVCTKARDFCVYWVSDQ